MGPGVQAWYNQFLAVDPTNAEPRLRGPRGGLRDARTAARTWTTAGPYWNFYFSCWRPTRCIRRTATNGCPQTTHSDQHSVAIGTVGGKAYVFVGNDGGIYRRPAQRHRRTRNGNGTDWRVLNDGTIDALQYYSVGVGKLNADDARPDLHGGDRVLVSGGLQDNGGSLLPAGRRRRWSRTSAATAATSSSTRTTAATSSRSTSRCRCGDADVRATRARIIRTRSSTCRSRRRSTSRRPTSTRSSSRRSRRTTRTSTSGSRPAPASGTRTRASRSRSGSQWQKVYSLPERRPDVHRGRLLGQRLLATWCGPCSTAARRSRAAPSSAPYADGDLDVHAGRPRRRGVPNRYLQGAAIDPNDANDLFLGVNGFSRRFTEGPGAGVGHIFESKDGGADLDGHRRGNFPDIPVERRRLPAERRALAATDLGVLYRARPASGSGSAARLPSPSHGPDVGPDGNLYAATHGRGIWRITAAALPGHPRYTSANGPPSAARCSCCGLISAALFVMIVLPLHGRCRESAERAAEESRHRARQIPQCGAGEVPVSPDGVMRGSPTRRPSLFVKAARVVIAAGSGQSYDPISARANVGPRGRGSPIRGEIYEEICRCRPSRSVTAKAAPHPREGTSNSRVERPLNGCDVRDAASEARHDGHGHPLGPSKWSPCTRSGGP